MVPQDSPHYTAIDLVEEELRRIFTAGYVVRVQGPLDLGPISQPEPDVAVVSGTIRDYAKAIPRRRCSSSKSQNLPSLMIAASKRVSMPVLVFQNIGC